MASSRLYSRRAAFTPHQHCQPGTAISAHSPNPRASVLECGGRAQRRRRFRPGNIVSNNQNASCVFSQLHLSVLKTPRPQPPLGMQVHRPATKSLWQYSRINQHPFVTEHPAKMVGRASSRAASVDRLSYRPRLVGRPLPCTPSRVAALETSTTMTNQNA